MGRAARLRVVILKPSKYAIDGHVERFRWGFMPNATIPHMASMTPAQIDGCPIETHVVDEYVQGDLRYLDLLRGDPDCRTLLALVGVQSHQMHRALDLAAYARHYGRSLCVLGGPHPMTCDTAPLHGRGISIALAEAELIWPQILADAVQQGELAPVYGGGRRWQQELDPVVLEPPTKRDLRRHVVPMLGVYPARGCPYKCSFCSIIKIAGHRVRSQPVEATLATLRAAAAAGVRLIMFTSDNFNKYPEAWELLDGMIQEDIRIPFFVQCDAQVAEQEDFVEQLGRAGCGQMFVGAESFDHQTLRAVKKNHNDPSKYAKIIALCHRYGVTSHFSNIIGFPGQTETSIREHLEVLLALGPDMASFYILTPIPGTDQYGDFLAEGLITERNLDRFDTTCLTWRHSDFDATRLEDLLYRCYRDFYATRKIAQRLRGWGSRFRSTTGWSVLAGSVFSGWSARRRHHPMSGGVGGTRIDHVSDYIELRRSTYGLDLLPLPANLELSAHDAELNRHAKLALPRRQSTTGAAA